MSSTTISQNELLKEELKYFETEIQKPNNQYSSDNNIITKNPVSKIAYKIDSTIDKIFSKIKDILKN